MISGSVEPVLVLGLGNLLLKDDAAGLRMLEALGDVPRGADSVDGGTQGLALLAAFSGRRAILILDAVGLGAPAGTVHLLRGPDIEQFRARRSTTAHEGNALELLGVARLLGDVPEEIAVVGIEPDKVETGVGLSPSVEAAIPEAVERARAILAEWGVPAAQKPAGEDRAARLPATSSVH